MSISNVITSVNFAFFTVNGYDFAFNLKTRKMEYPSEASLEMRREVYGYCIRTW